MSDGKTAVSKQDTGEALNELVKQVDTSLENLIELKRNLIVLSMKVEEGEKNDKKAALEYLHRARDIFAKYGFRPDALQEIEGRVQELERDDQ